MTRTHIVVDLSTGSQSEVDYTPEEEAQADADYAAWLAAIGDPPLPTVDPPCVARLDVAEGDIQSVAADSGIAFAFAINTNVFQVYFATSKPNGYTWAVSSTSGSAKVTDPQADYVEITIITDPTEPYSVSVQIFTVS